MQAITAHIMYTRIFEIIAEICRIDLIGSPKTGKQKFSSNECKYSKIYLGGQGRKYRC